jgi:hypothetical protein
VNRGHFTVREGSGALLRRAGQTFADEPQCLEAYRDKGADLKILRACAGGVDRAPLDKCLAVLVDQHCDADLGPVTAMPDCDKYCSRVDV